MYRAFALVIMLCCVANVGAVSVFSNVDVSVSDMSDNAVSGDVYKTQTLKITFDYGNISVYRVEPNYIIWSVTENITSMVIDGYDVLVSGGYYGQYANVSPGTKHFACVNGNECISVVTPDDGISVLGNWIIYLVLIASCIVCARVPITCVFPIVMGVYLINVHLPSIGAPFEEYLLCAVLMIMGIISAIIGFTRR